MKKKALLLTVILSGVLSLILLGKLWKANDTLRQANLLTKQVEAYKKEFKHLEDLKKETSELDEGEKQYSPLFTQEAEKEMLLHQKVVDLARKEFDSKEISGVLEIGDGYISEPVIIDPNQYYNRRLPNGEYSMSGTVMMYGPQSSLEENYSSYYGHSMENGSRFGKLLKVNKVNKENKYNEITKLTLYTEKSSKSFELAYVVKLSEMQLDRADINSFRGIQELLKKNKASTKTVFSNKEISEKDFLITLNTCANKSGSERLLFLYKEVK